MVILMEKTKMLPRRERGLVRKHQEVGVRIRGRGNEWIWEGR